MDLFTALTLLLNAGDGLFLGNSMPIRDMDMYAAGRRPQAADGMRRAGLGDVPSGMPPCRCEMRF